MREWSYFLLLMLCGLRLVMQGIGTARFSGGNPCMGAGIRAAYSKSHSAAVSAGRGPRALGLQVCRPHRKIRSIAAIGDGTQNRTKSLINELPHQIFVLNPARRCAAVDAPSPRMRQADGVKMFSVESIWRIAASRATIWQFIIPLIRFRSV
jgi:hypothetical protein